MSRWFGKNFLQRKNMLDAQLRKILIFSVLESRVNLVMDDFFVVFT